MAIDWTNYKALGRADKAALINRFDRETRSAAQGTCQRDVRVEYALIETAWMLRLRTLNLCAAEIAEAILLCEIPFPYSDYDGDGPIGQGQVDKSADDIIDRAMYMASQWKDGGYPDCFCMHDIGHTKFGSLDRLRAVAMVGEFSETVANEIEAGAIAAKAASDVHNFLMMTERSAASSGEKVPAFNA